MSLLKINDPLQKHANIKADVEDDIAIGLDFGTSNSVISYYKNGKIQIIPDEFGNIIPSIIAYKSNAVVGNKALQESDGIIIKSIKRLMGRNLTQLNLQEIPYEITTDDASNNLKITVADNKRFLPEEIVADILKYLKIVAEKHLGKKVTKAVITVPAYFDETQRISVKNSAKLANLQVLRLINEPTSAALAYGLDEGLEGIYVIYDLGGGTFDVSILQLAKGIFTVKATAGDTLLGGDDIDYLIYNDIFANYIKTNVVTNIDKSYLLRQAKLIKEELSVVETVNKKITINQQEITVNYTKENLQEHVHLLCEKTLNICKQALQDADVLRSEVTGVVLVGGSTKMPYIQNITASFFKCQPLSTINPDEVVSIGAGYKAAELTGKTKGSLLLDVIPLSLGIEIAGGLVEKIIPRNSVIPITKMQEFTTFKDNQTAISIHVLQGERELVNDVRSLGKFVLKGIPLAVAGAIKILVTFSIDADGLLIVECCEKTSNIKQVLEIKPSWGLDIIQMRTMIEDSIENSEADVLNRLLIQSKVEAERVIDALIIALKEDSNLLSTESELDIKQALQVLQKSLDSKIKDEIDNNLQILEKKIHKFAELRMEKHIQQSLQGRKLNEFSENNS